MQCPYCGGDAVEYIGTTDGGGPYGTSVCEEWRCTDCDAGFEADCVDLFNDWPVDEEADA